MANGIRVTTTRKNSTPISAPPPTRTDRRRSRSSRAASAFIADSAARIEFAAWISAVQAAASGSIESSSPASLSRDSAPVQLLKHDGVELGRHDHFQHLAIIGIVEHGVLDARRLDPAGASLHGDRPLPFEFRLQPAFEDVDHLKIDIVIMRYRHLLGPEWGDKTDDVRLHHPARRWADAEIAILRVGSQPARKIRFVQMTDGEFPCRPRLGLGLGPHLPCA